MHVTDIVLRVAVAEHIRNLPGKEHVVSVLVEDIGSDAEPVPEHHEIDTDVPCLGGFPCNVRNSISSLGGGHYGYDVGSRVHRDRTEVHDTLIWVVTDLLVTEGTIGSTDLHKVEGLEVHCLYPWFFRDYPPEGSGREETAAVCAVEARRHIVTGVELEEIASENIIGDSSEVGAVCVLGGVSGA